MVNLSAHWLWGYFHEHQNAKKRSFGDTVHAARRDRHQFFFVTSDKLGNHAPAWEWYQDDMMTPSHYWQRHFLFFVISSVCPGIWLFIHFIVVVGVVLAPYYCCLSLVPGPLLHAKHSPSRMKSVRDLFSHRDVIIFINEPVPCYVTSTIKLESTLTRQWIHSPSSLYCSHEMQEWH